MLWRSETSSKSIRRVFRFHLLTYRKFKLNLPIIRKHHHMKIAVFDTYVTKRNGSLMHFDILVPEGENDQENIHSFGKMYLKEKNQDGQPLTSKECSFCHIEQASADVEADIVAKGYSIIEMEGCND